MYTVAHNTLLEAPLSVATKAGEVHFKGPTMARKNPRPKKCDGKPGLRARAAIGATPSVPVCRGCVTAKSTAGSLATQLAATKLELAKNIEQKKLDVTLFNTTQCTTEATTTASVKAVKDIGYKVTLRDKHRTVGEGAGGEQGEGGRHEEATAVLSTEKQRLALPTQQVKEGTTAMAASGRWCLEASHAW